MHTELQAAERSPIGGNEGTPTLHCDVISQVGSTSCGLASAGTGPLRQSKEAHSPARAGPRQGGPGGLHSPREAPAGRKLQAVAKLGRACWWTSTPGGRKGPQ